MLAVELQAERATIAKTKYVNDKQITDHYAIIPTGDGQSELASVGELARKVYDRIVRRFLAIFYPPAEYQKISMELELRGEHFFSSFKVLENPGYLALYGTDEAKQAGADEQTIKQLNRVLQGIKK